MVKKPSRFALAGARLRRLLAWLGLAGMAAALPVPVLAQSVPQHWISYAQLVGGQLQQGLSDPANEAVVRLHSWMQARILSGAEPQQAAQPLRVRVWIAASGRVSQAEFASLGQAQADADLRAVLTAQSITEAPPPDMRQPLVLELALGFGS
ncbi:YbaB/EbfC family DNA-binding protein [Xenophilus arseniciresistens]|uniref:YbaB/EbfC family DNA-binding protein n=1 Tax=Xenophilus arseniciresistens TaxID=1283306 RepID=A0AAE3N388_9BURK|nr:YbaB/EbfC family DNA-binding protein [Xenophilus arseniciresistens]MDA7414990.1 YbaB/EbfC family DNA-binding protein [Xenophilus arseniciresistens]